MRRLVVACVAFVAVAAIVWIPMRFRSRHVSAAAASAAPEVAGAASAPSGPAPEKGPFLGFDRDIYPGDDELPILRKTFTFAGFWLGPPPGEKVNTWKGKHELMKSLGFGVAALYRARPLNEVKKDAAAKQKAVIDAKAAAEGAKAEGFAPNTVIFLDI